ncbi:hypothetical protein [Nonomuraea sp. NPDC005650]|uniref:hypothetical protein n=1 Tax=Nonomuraea sp. NPDC005650 TaxID=3157045 RepID=UPI0033A899F0
MVHRLDKLVPDAWVRAGRSLLQNVISVAIIAGGPAIVTAAQGGTADMGALGLAGGQAGLAAVLAFLYTRFKPATAGALGEATFRAGRSVWQNILAAAIVAGAPAVAVVAQGGTADLKTLGLAGAQASLAGVVSYVYNLVAPRRSDSEPGEVDGSGPAAEGMADPDSGESFGGPYDADSRGDGYRSV